MRVFAFLLLALAAPSAAMAVLDAGVDTTTGETIGPDQLAARLDTTRLLLGESHTSVESHRMRLQVLRALARRGRASRIGLEMFHYTEQASLDMWNAGRWTEAEFVDKARGTNTGAITGAMWHS